MRRLRLLALALAVLAGPRTAPAYPIAQERELGERFSLEAASQLPLLREPTVADYVNRLAGRMVSRLEAPQPFDYRFSVVKDGQLNAFAVPGGFVYVNSGLLLRVSNDSELAGVLGHEIGHVHAHHIVRQQEKSQLVSYAALAGMLLSVVQPAIGAAAMGAGAAVQLKYAREFEQEADYLGVRYMREAGFDPHGMTSFMRKIWEEKRGATADVPPYLLSHPMTDARISNLEVATKDLPVQPDWQRPSFELERAQAVLRALGGERAAVRAAYEKRAQSASPRALALYGIVLLHQGDAALARAPLEKARAAEPAAADDLGLARLRAGDLAGAMQTLRGRVEEAPDDALAHAYLGTALLEKEDYAEAARVLERALELSPALDQVEYDLGQSYGRAGDQGRGMFHVARAAEIRGEIERAAASYEKAERLLPAGSAEAAVAAERRKFLEESLTRRVIGRR